jgi:hypothetical protein
MSIQNHTGNSAPDNHPFLVDKKKALLTILPADTLSSALEIRLTGRRTLPTIATVTGVFSNNSLGGVMNKRGRPKQDGRKLFWVVERVILAVYAYGRARDRGEKRSVAISEAVEYIRATALGMRVSETEVKRIVATWRPQLSATCLFIAKPRPEHSTITLLNGRKARILYTVSIRLRPIYPRANGAEKHMRRRNLAPCNSSVAPGN